MFASLADAVEHASVTADGETIAATLGLIDRLTAKLTAAVGGFDADCGWIDDGATSTTAWLRNQRMHRADAAGLVRNARRTRRLPVLASAWADGSLSSGQVRAVLEVVPQRHLALFAEHEADVIPRLVPLSVDDVGQVMNRWVQWADELNPPPPSLDKDGTAHLSGTLDGRGRLDANLTPEGFALASTALRVADCGDLDVPAAVRRGQALCDIFGFFLDNHTETTVGSRHRPHLNLTVDWDAANRGEPLDGYLTETGIPLHSDALATLLCDCNINRVITRGPSTILDYGSSTPTFTASQRNALIIRDHHCRFPGCDRPPTWCDAHHVRWFTRNGPTAITNGALLCKRHHRLLHTPGWDATIDADDATLTVRSPDGTIRTSRPPGTRQPPLPGHTEPGEPEPQPPPHDHRDCPTAEETRAVRRRLQDLRDHHRRAG